MADIGISLSALPALTATPQPGLQDPQDRPAVTEDGVQTDEAVAGAAETSVRETSARETPARETSTDDDKSRPEDGRGGLLDVTV